jgi:hypothetical protein
MKTVLRARDDKGNIIATIRQEELPSPTRVLVRFSIAMFFLALILSIL